VNGSSRLNGDWKSTAMRSLFKRRNFRDSGISMNLIDWHLRIRFEICCGRFEFVNEFVKDDFR
jgi:hypothetical protein